MSDPVLSFILVIAFFALLTAVSWFKTLEATLWREARTPLAAGAIAGGLIHFADNAPARGLILTLAALYVRLTGRESEPADGMILGAMTGGGAAIPLVVLDGDVALLRFASCILAGAVAGYGITFGLTHVRDRLRQLSIDAVTAVAAIGVAALPPFLVRNGLDARYAAAGAAALVPVVVIAAVFRQWPVIRAELRHEAALGVLDDEDVRPTAHPLRRLGRGGWHDAGAHREFVRIANKIALRKLRQRGRSEEMARLYQVEVIKLRMVLQQMVSVDRAMRVHDEQQQAAR